MTTDTRPAPLARLVARAIAVGSVSTLVAACAKDSPVAPPASEIAPRVVHLELDAPRAVGAVVVELSNVPAGATLVAIPAGRFVAIESAGEGVRRVLVVGDSVGGRAVRIEQPATGRASAIAATVREAADTANAEVAAATVRAVLRASP